MEAKTEYECKHAYILTADALSKSWKLLHNNIGSVKASAKCSDNIERQFTDLEELAAYENPRVRQIETIALSAWSNDKNENVYI